MYKVKLKILLLEKLKHRNVGTNQVEHFVKKIEDVKLRDHMRRAMMGCKIKNAYECEETVKSKFDKSFEYVKRRFGQDMEFFDEYKKIMQGEAEYAWKEGREKIGRKATFLVSKWKKKPEPNVDSEWREVAISDEKLDEKYEAQPTKIPNPDNIPLSDNETKAMEIPPGWTTHEQITVTKINASIESFNCKLRWALREREERDGEPWTEELEWDKVRERQVFEEDSATMSFANKRVTDIKTCRRINVPDIADEQTELILANMKTRAVGETRTCIQKNCDKER